MKRRVVALGTLLALLAVTAGVLLEAPRLVCFSAVDATPFLGTWQSEADGEGNAVKVVVDRRGGGTFVKIGHCHGSSCDWSGPVRATCCRTNPFAETAQSLRADFLLGFATDSGVLTRAGSGRLVLDIRRHWIIEDGGPRPDSHETRTIARH